MQRKLKALALCLILLFSSCAPQPKKYSDYDLSELRRKKTEQKTSDKWFLISLVAGIVLMKAILNKQDR